MTTSYPFIHHVCIYPSDFGASEVFYSAALAPLGLLPGDLAEDAVEYWEQREGEGERDTPSFALTQAPSAKDETRGVHLAFTARDRVEVDAFHRAALATGGTERHAPRLWPEYRAYCAFVSDPDGNNVEAVHKEI